MNCTAQPATAATNWPNRIIDTWRPRTPEELAGAAILGLERGEISQDEFEDRMRQARELKANPEIGRNASIGYV